MKFTIQISRDFELNDLELNLLKELEADNGIYNATSNQNQGVLLDKLVDKELAHENSSNLVTINEYGKKILESLSECTCKKPFEGGEWELCPKHI